MSEQFDASRPIYAQLVERLKARILAGTYPPGGHLDSVLESEGLVRTERTSGRYVTEDTNLIEQLRAAAAHDIAADFLEKMRSIGYTPEKAAALLEHWDTEEVEPHE